jgi:hypothetical protein
MAPGLLVEHAMSSPAATPFEGFKSIFIRAAST